MRFVKLTLAVVTAVGLLAGFSTEARAGGGSEPCVVTTKSDIQGTDKLKGSAVIVLRNFDPVQGLATSADATLTLSYNDITAVFRTTVQSPNITSAEGVMCDVLTANPTTSSGATIFDVFGFAAPVPPTTVSDVLKLCLIVVPKTGAVTCQSIDHLDFSQIPGTSDWTGAIGKLTVYRIP
jgi:hypothetical protein